MAEGDEDSRERAPSSTELAGGTSNHERLSGTTTKPKPKGSHAPKKQVGKKAFLAQKAPPELIFPGP